MLYVGRSSLGFGLVMTGKSRKLRAIDLYSGVGGWALGLRLAGIDVVASYDLSGEANETNFKNNHHQAQTVDIRRLGLNELPSSVDIVVGSPPCTQFSFSNRGGNGDIEDGLKDIIKFLAIVDHLRPTWWVMENVPRVASIIEEELRPRGRLRRFRHLNLALRVVNMEDFGLPQRRTRCIVGNMPFDLLAAYSRGAPRRTLGLVVKALSGKRLRDPIYGFPLPRQYLRDHLQEGFLNVEEIRINRANKAFHPIYNSMPFPDRLDRSVRTLTATCTRVSRQSVIIVAPEDSTKYRRLTIRERASLQGFPITFQFYAASYSKKMRMVGNALPPLFSYYVGQTIKGTPPEEVRKFSQLGPVFELPATLAENSHPEKSGLKYPPNRSFRFAIPSLRLKSGVRFELVNATETSRTLWEVNFYFGTSKSIHSIEMESVLAKMILKRMQEPIRVSMDTQLERLADFIAGADIQRMQQVWSHRGLGTTTPFMLLDCLDEVGLAIRESVRCEASSAQKLVKEIIDLQFASSSRAPVGISKLLKNAPTILAGLLVGSIANPLLRQRASRNKSPRLAGIR